MKLKWKLQQNCIIKKKCQCLYFIHSVLFNSAIFKVSSNKFLHITQITALDLHILIRYSRVLYNNTFDFIFTHI
jgi:hypothetical protein